jgi:putative colanic acid biosynthesis acetyltransferase WcaF
MKTDLSKYNNSHFKPGNKLKILIWYFVNVLFFINPLNPFSFPKVLLLRIFGAVIGKGVVIKPGVNIKYPWFLEIGEYVWIGENVWIDNLAKVTIKSNVCVSQGAMLLCGNHNYKKETFDLITRGIVLEEGAWIGAKSIVCPGVHVRSHALLAVNSVANQNLEPYTIYQGNPAVEVRKREIKA